MRMNRLQALRAVMETGSVTEASRRIHRTQPQISRLISALEAEVGFTLFLRQGRGLVPTHECLRFYEGTRHILAGFEEVSRIASSIRNQQDAWLRILTQPYLAYSVTPAAIAEFSRLHPRVKVSLEVRSRVEVGLWMSGQQFDLGLAALPIDFPGIRSRSFADVRLVIAMPERHRLAAKSVVTVDDIKDEPFIALRPYAAAQAHRRPDGAAAPAAAHGDGDFVRPVGLPAGRAGRGRGAGRPGAGRQRARHRAAGFRALLTLPYGFLLPNAYAPSEQAREFARIFVRLVKETAPQRVELGECSLDGNALLP